MRIAGERSDHAIAFARQRETRWIVTVTPCWPMMLGGNVLAGEGDWRDTRVELPDGAPAEWKNVLTDESVSDFHVSTLLRNFPVALLSAG